MRTFALTISAMVSSIVAFAQPEISPVRFKDEDLLSDIDSTRYIKKVYGGKNDQLFLYRIFNKATDRIEIEFIRESDSTFRFFSYHPTGKEKLTGIALIDPKWFDSLVIQIPDFSKDPDGAIGTMKDTVINEYHLRGIEYWWEHDSTGKYSAGCYGENGKTGYWFSGFYLRNRDYYGSWFVNTKKERYSQGKPVHNSVVEFDRVSWPEIKGKWMYNHNYSDDSIYLFNREIPVSTRSSSITFISETHYKSIRPGHHGGIPYTEEWWTKGDRLFLKSKGNTTQYRIISFIGNQLVLELIRERTPDPRLL